MYKKLRFVMVIVLLVSALIIGKQAGRYVSGTKVTEGKDDIMVILDPGHGGNDPGKIGVNKSKEKEINLLIAEKLQKKLKEAKVKVKMTRTTDEGLYSENASNHKIEDMKERVRIINEIKPKLVVSIHQNSYTGESIKGAQVFYFTHSIEGKEAAEIMQENLRLIDTGNKRKAKGNNTYYMLKKTEVPTIIVECGFLSNWEEAKKLVTDEYQNKIAQAIFDGIIEILQKEK